MAVTSNPKVREIAFMLVVALAALCTAPVAKTTHIDACKEYVLIVGSNELRFTARPELGYVVKTQQDAPSIEALDEVLKSVGAVNISPIGGLGRKGTCVVYSERSADENERTIKLLRSRSEVQYVAPLFSSNGETVAIIPEIVVRVKPGTDIEQVQMLCEAAGCTINKRMEFTEQEYLVEVLGPDAEAVFAAVEQLGQTPYVEWACPNTASRPKLCGQAIPDDIPSGEQLWFGAPEHDANTPGVFPNDEYFPRQWHLHNTGQSGGTPGADIRAPEAWEITTGDPNIVVAEFAGYLDTNHEDLVNNVVPGRDFVQPGSTPVYDYWVAGHSTWCAGIIAAQGNNGIGVAGVTWNCKVMPIRIWADRPLPQAHVFLPVADISEAIRWAAANGAGVLDCQWGYTSPQPVLQSALADVTEPRGIGRGGKGCVVVFLSGMAPNFWYPGQYREVIAVGSTDHNDVRNPLYPYGPELDLVAPDHPARSVEEFMTSKGRGFLWTTDVTGSPGLSADPGMHPDPNILDYTASDGATSIVCGVAALVLSVDPNLTNLDVQRILMRSARDLGERGWDQYYGFGRVDARAAVEMALNPPPPLYVDDDALNDPGAGNPDISDPNEDGSAEHPYDSIQEAITNAPPGETVIVLPGTYGGKGNRDISFLGRVITVRSLDPNDSEVVAATVIDCQGTQAAQHQGFVFKTGESAQSVLTGLTITNAYASYAGGILCANNSSPTIRQCVLRGNTAVTGGGGFYNQSGSPTVINCIVTGNTGGNGSALYNLSNARVVNCTFSKNSATGGGIHNQWGTLTLTNCILWDNTPSEVRIVGGTVSITYSDIKGGFAGAGNKASDPLFADPANGDYHLKSHGGRWNPVSQSWVIDGITSPCIDAGDPSSPVGDEPQPNGGRINMGAYGGTAEASKSP